MPYEGGGEGGNDGLLAEDAEESCEVVSWPDIDDSMLVVAASEEHEVCSRSRFLEPMNKSPLSSSPSNKKPKPKPQAPSNIMLTVKGDFIETDSRPLNFDTFVPTHDPSLPTLPSSSSVPESSCTSQSLAEFSGPMVSQDEAFSRALNAMYWGGYWTAVCHYQKRNHAENIPVQEDGEEPAEADEEDNVRDDASMTHPQGGGVPQDLIISGC